MSRILLILLGLALPLSLFAQEDSLTETKSADKGMVNIKVDYANLINPIDPTLLVSLEYYLRPSFSISPEFGYIGQLPNKEYDDRFSGWKFRQEFRYYLSGMVDESTITYISINLMYRSLQARGDYIVGYGCNASGRGCEYYQNLNGSVANNRFAALLRFGIFSYLSDRIFLEFDYGAGLRYNREAGPIAPHNAVMLVPLELLANHNGLHPYFTLSCKVGILLFRRKEG